MLVKLKEVVLFVMRWHVMQLRREWHLIVPLGLLGVVYSCMNQYISEVFRSTEAEYGYVGEDFFACFACMSSNANLGRTWVGFFRTHA